MKLSGILSAFALAGTAFSAVIPRTVILETLVGMTTLAVVIDELDKAIEDIKPIVCSSATQQDIAKLENTLIGVQYKLAVVVPGSISTNQSLSVSWAGAINNINGLLEQVESTACGTGLFSLDALEKELVAIEGLLALIDPFAGVAVDAVNTVQPLVENAAESALVTVAHIVENIRNGSPNADVISNLVKGIGAEFPLLPNA